MQKKIHEQIQQKIDRLNQSATQHCQFSSQKNDHLLQEIINDILTFSEMTSASDVHIEPQKNNIRIRFRIDGVLSEQFHIPKFIQEQLCSKLKILANLNITQTRFPQDGKFIAQSNNSVKIHIRISTCPTIYGEKIVLRLLHDTAMFLTLNDLGIIDNELENLKNALAYPSGLILVTGPTGSGKTSTLYAALDHLNHCMKNIITIEDPVEIQLEGVNQISVNSDLTFEIILRSILRQDPDIIMIGEIRDQKTAEIAIQAANTGHLVLSTLHTNNCIETINRLKQMNIQEHDLISCLRLIVSQRLLRKKCAICATKKSSMDCHCEGGYKGRFGLFEILNFDEKLKKYISQNKIYDENSLIAVNQFSPIEIQARLMVKKDMTTEEEVKRVFNIIM